MAAIRHLYYVLDNDKNPVKATLEEWAVWFEVHNNRIIKRSRLLNGKVVISTVFLGLDHGLMGLPILFETMVFAYGEEEGQWRFSTWVEAICHHNDILSKWTKKVGQHDAAIADLIDSAGISQPNE